MSSTKASPQTWTLRFKHHRTTILLHIDPLQKLSSVKADLLSAIQQTHLSGILNDHTIPLNASEIVLARPRDINDLSRGWENLEPNTSSAGFDDEEGGKGKGKAAVNSTAAGKRKDANGKNNALRDCPQGVGLRDGGVVAFKFRSRKDDEKREKVDGDGEAIIQVDEEDEEDGREEWDVVVPTLEETYGESGGGGVVGMGGEGG